METRKYYIVYPDSLRLDLSDTNKPIAWFKVEDQARRWASEMYRGFFSIKELELSDADIRTLSFDYAEQVKETHKDKELTMNEQIWMLGASVVGFEEGFRAALNLLNRVQVEKECNTTEQQTN